MKTLQLLAFVALMTCDYFAAAAGSPFLACRGFKQSFLLRDFFKLLI